MIRQEIEKAIREALSALGAPKVDFVVERPGSMGHGDYATNAALKAMGPASHGNFSNSFEKNSTWTVGRPNS